jgi:CheY-like chemotaxis protein
MPGIKALVVDDNEVNALVLANMLELFHVEVDEVYSGKEAVDKVKKNQYQIIFIDHIMTEMDGVETTKKVRAIQKDMKDTMIYALSGNITEDIKQRFISAGANDIYSKPIALTEMIAILQNWIPKEELLLESWKMKIEPITTDDGFIESILTNIHEIDINIGLKYALGNPIHYMNILKVSLKDIQTCLDRINRNYKKGCMEEIKNGLHNLKSVFANIGAISLSEETRNLEMMIIQGDFAQVYMELLNNVTRIKIFRIKLLESIRIYEDEHIHNNKEQEIGSNAMKDQEYEQYLSDIIYYIRRYEYDSIIREIEHLIRVGIPEIKSELKKALSEIKEFQYDKVLGRILDLKERLKSKNSN